MKKKVKIIEKKKKSDFWSNFIEISVAIMVVSFAIASVIFLLVYLMFLNTLKLDYSFWIFLTILFCVAWIMTAMLLSAKASNYKTITKEKEVIIEEIKSNKRKK